MSCWEKIVPRSTPKKAGFWRSTRGSQQIPPYLWRPRGSGLQGCAHRRLETKLRAHPGKGGCEIRNPCIDSGPLKDDTLSRTGGMFCCRTVKKLACVGLAFEGNRKKQGSVQRIQPYTQHPGSQLGLTKFTEPVRLKKPEDRNAALSDAWITLQHPGLSAEAAQSLP